MRCEVRDKHIRVRGGFVPLSIRHQNRRSSRPWRHFSAVQAADCRLLSRCKLVRGISLWPRSLQISSSSFLLILSFAILGSSSRRRRRRQRTHIRTASSGDSASPLASYDEWLCSALDNGWAAEVFLLKEDGNGSLTTIRISPIANIASATSKRPFSAPLVTVIRSPTERPRTRRAAKKKSHSWWRWLSLSSSSSFMEGRDQLKWHQRQFCD